MLKKSIGFITYPKLQQPSPYSRMMETSKLDIPQRYQYTLRPTPKSLPAGGVLYNTHSEKDEPLKEQQHKMSGFVNTDAKTALIGNVGHEAQHSVFSKIKQLHGQDFAKKLIEHTLSVLTPLEKKVLNYINVDNKKYRKEALDEELISHFHNYLQDNDYRNIVHRKLGLSPTGAKNLHNTAKHAWKKIRTHAQTLDFDTIQKSESEIEDNLSKRDVPVFPKLGIKDRLRSVELINHPKPLYTKLRTMAHAGVKKQYPRSVYEYNPSTGGVILAPVSDETKKFYQAAAASEARKAYYSAAYGTTSTAGAMTGSNLGYALSGLLRPAMWVSEKENESQATKLHEEFHGQMGRIEEKYGKPARTALAGNLWNSLTHSQRNLIDYLQNFWAGDYYSKSPGHVEEEKLARLFNHLNSSDTRHQFHDAQFIKTHELPNGDVAPAGKYFIPGEKKLYEGHEFDTELKNAHRNLLAAAEVAGNNWLKFGHVGKPEEPIQPPKVDDSKFEDTDPWVEKKYRRGGEEELKNWWKKYQPKPEDQPAGQEDLKKNNADLTAKITPTHLYRAYKNSPHHPVSLLLKYIVNRIENKDIYENSSPEEINKYEQGWLQHHQFGAASTKNGHVKANDLRKAFDNNPELVNGILEHQSKLHQFLYDHGNVKDINGVPSIPLARGLKVDDVGADHDISSYTDQHHVAHAFGDNIQRNWVPLKNVYFSYDLGPQEASSEKFGPEDEFLVSNHPRIPASFDDIRKLVSKSRYSYGRSLNYLIQNNRHLTEEELNTVKNDTELLSHAFDNDHHQLDSEYLDNTFGKISGSTWLSKAILTHPNLSDSTIDRVATTGLPSHVNRLLANKNITEKHINTILNRKDFDTVDKAGILDKVYENHGHNINFDPKIANEIFASMDHHNPYIESISRYVNSPELIDKYINNLDSLTRAGRFAVRPKIAALLDNPNLTSEHLDNIKSNFHSFFLQKVLNHPNYSNDKITAEDVAEVLDSEGYLYNDVVKNFNKLNNAITDSPELMNQIFDFGPIRNNGLGTPINSTQNMNHIVNFFPHKITGEILDKALDHVSKNPSDDSRDATRSGRVVERILQKKDKRLLDLIKPEHISKALLNPYNVKHALSHPRANVDHFKQYENTQDEKIAPVIKAKRDFIKNKQSLYSQFQSKKNGWGWENEVEPSSLPEVGTNLNKNDDEVQSEALSHMLGYSNQLQIMCQAARFLSGKETDFKKLTDALGQYDGNLKMAVLAAHGIDVSPGNVKALDSVSRIQDMSKSIALGEKYKVSPTHPESEETAKEIQNSIDNGHIQKIKLSGKHSSGSLLVKTDNEMWLLKPGSGGTSPALGVKEEQATQSERETAYWHIANVIGLGHSIPQSELITVNSKQYAAIKMLPLDWRNLESLKPQEPNIGRIALEPYRISGELFKWAILDYVLGNTDRHSMNLMVSPKEDGYKVALIDHGSAFAGFSFNPGQDKNSWVPYYLRVWSNGNWSELTQEEKIKSLPKASATKEQEIFHWLLGINPDSIAAVMQRYGIEAGPSVSRLNQVKSCKGAIDKHIGELWVI
jgi:hypothetical protein